MSMIIKITNIKRWCNASLSPVAWIRITIECLPELNKLGYTLQELNNPTGDFFLDEKALRIIDKQCFLLYQKHIKFLDLIGNDYN